MMLLFQVAFLRVYFQYASFTLWAHNSFLESALLVCISFLYLAHEVLRSFSFSSIASILNKYIYALNCEHGLNRSLKWDF